MGNSQYQSRCYKETQSKTQISLSIVSLKDRPIQRFAFISKNSTQPFDLKGANIYMVNNIENGEMSITNLFPVITYQKQGIQYIKAFTIFVKFRTTVSKDKVYLGRFVNSPIDQIYSIAITHKNEFVLTITNQKCQPKFEPLICEMEQLSSQENLKCEKLFESYFNKAEKVKIPKMKLKDFM